MVAFTKIKFGEDHAASQLGGEVRQIGACIVVWLCLQVKLAKVAAGASRAIGLVDHVEGRGPIGLGATNNTLFLQKLKLCLGSLKFFTV